MNKVDTWMPIYIGDYLKDTTALSAAEHGAYLLLLFHGWQNDGRLPCEDSRLARIVGMDAKEWALVKPAVLSFFTPGSGCYYQSRQLEELAKAQEVQAKNHARAVAGGQANREAWRKRQAKLEDSLKHSLTIAPSPSPSPIPNNASSVVVVPKTIQIGKNPPVSIHAKGERK